MAFDTPTDGNYTAWHSALAGQVNSHCASWQFSVPELLTGGRGLLQSMAKPRAQRHLEAWLGAESGATFGGYLGHRNLALTMLIVGALLFVISLLFTFSLKASFRDCIGRALCGVCGPEPRRRHRGVERHHRHGLTTVNFVFGIIALLASIFLVIGGANLIHGVDRTACNVWMHMYGHFFGTDDLSRGSINDIVLNWGGTDSINTQLAKLEQNLTPGPENPTYLAFIEGLDDVKTEMKAKAASLNETAFKAMELTKNHTDVLAAIPNNEKQLATAVLVSSKTTEFLANIFDTMNKAFDVLTDAVEKLVGIDAPLLLAATDGLDKTKSTIRGIDASLAALTRKWSSLSKTLRTVIILIACLTFLVALCALAALAVLSVAAFRLTRVPETFTEPPNDRKFWAWTYGGLVVTAGLAALVCGIMCLAASVGIDACNTVEGGIFTRGEWSLLGDEVLYPMESMPVDMSVVFDSCVKSDGEGNVISSLGLGRPLAVLSDAIDEAHVQIKNIQKNLVNEQEALYRVALLGTIWRDVLTSHYRQLSSSVDGEEAFYFNQTRQLSLENRDYAITGQNNFLCLVPQYETKDILGILSSCTELMYKIASSNEGIDFLNNVAAWVKSIKSDATLPAKWCTSTLKQTGHECGRWDVAKTTYITDETTKDMISTWVQDVDATVGDKKFDQFDNVQKRLEALLQEILAIEKLAATKIETVNEDGKVTCPKGSESDSCTYNEVRMSDIKKFEDLALTLKNEFTTFLKRVGTYVDELLLPTLDSFINDATALNDHGNCQFQGTALRQAAMVAMCDSTLPAASMSMIWSAVVSVACFLLSVHSWGWYHYFADLERHEGSSFEAMSSAKEYVAYTGFPSSAAHRETGVLLRAYDGSPHPLIQQEGMHVAVMPSTSVVSSSFVTCDLTDASAGREKTTTDP